MLADLQLDRDQPVYAFVYGMFGVGKTCLAKDMAHYVNVQLALGSAQQPASLSSVYFISFSSSLLRANKEGLEASSQQDFEKQLLQHQLELLQQIQPSLSIKVHFDMPQTCGCCSS